MCTCGPKWAPNDLNACHSCGGRPWVETEEKGVWVCKCCAMEEDGEEYSPEGEDLEAATPEEITICYIQCFIGRGNDGQPITGRNVKIVHKLAGEPAENWIPGSDMTVPLLCSVEEATEKMLLMNGTRIC